MVSICCSPSLRNPARRSWICPSAGKKAYTRSRSQADFHHGHGRENDANFVVAASGAVVLLENEGNIRLSTTIPRIHVAVTGIEKVVPTWEDLSVLLQLLPRSATGQKLSSYVSLFLGPRRLGEPDGPEEFHLVLVDNGRSRILADEAFRESLRSIRCGACLNICPVCLKTGGHAYGWVYSGPTGSVLTPQLLRDRQCTSTLPFASTLCGPCADLTGGQSTKDEKRYTVGDRERILARIRNGLGRDVEKHSVQGIPARPVARQVATDAPSREVLMQRFSEPCSRESVDVHTVCDMAKPESGLPGS